MSDEPARATAAGGDPGRPTDHGPRLSTKIGIDTEELTGRTFPYQFDRSLVEDVDLVAATPGADINWLEDVHLMREDEYARKVLITHLREGNSYGIWLKARHAKFPQPELGPWRDDSPTVGGSWEPPALAEGERPTGH